MTEFDLDNPGSVEDVTEREGEKVIVEDSEGKEYGFVLTPLPAYEVLEIGESAESEYKALIELFIESVDESTVEPRILLENTTDTELLLGCINKLEGVIDVEIDESRMEDIAEGN